MSLFFRKTTGQLIAEKVAVILSSLNPIQTDWSFVGFDSFGGSIGTPGASLSIGLTGGELKVQKTNGSQPTSIKCGSVDGGVGISPVPFNISFPLPVPGASKGIIYKLPTAFSGLTTNSFRGGYVAVSGFIGCGPGIGVSFLFMGAKTIPMPGQDISSLVLKMAMNSEALVVTLGLNGALPDVGLTGSVGVAV